MKSIILVSVILAAALTAQASPDQDVIVNLQPVNINRVQFANKNIVAASLVVSQERNSVTLSVFISHSCAPGLSCAAVMPRPIVIELPVVSTRDLECGARVLRAGRHGRTPGDAAQSLTIVDNTSFSANCPTIQRVQPIEVNYETAAKLSPEGNPVILESSFAGEEFFPFNL